MIPKSKIQNPIAGLGYVAGRSHRHAELAAFGNALMQHPGWCDLTPSSKLSPVGDISRRCFGRNVYPADYG